MRAHIIIFLVLFFPNLCKSQWIIYKPTNNPTIKKCKILEDITSHTNSSWNDPLGDLATVAHERLHTINSDIRLKHFRFGQNTFYTFNSTAYVVKEPKNITLNDLAKSIPVKYRGQVYQLYLINQQKYFNNQPSYILDEQTAYTAGTICALQLNNKYRADDSGFRMLETLIYAVYLKKLTNQEDINGIVDFQIERCKLIYQKLPKQNLKVIQNYKFLESILNDKI